MNRKNFLSSIVPMGAVLTSFSEMENIPLPDNNSSLIPQYLKKGDTIGITCPAGYISLDDIQPAIKKISEWGFKIKIGDTVGRKDFTFGGTDEERKNDFQKMLDDGNIKAILCARGGYGFIRIIDRLNFKKFIQKPKWILGFSDVTLLHCHLQRNFGIASIHSKMCNSFPADWDNAEAIQQETIESIHRCLLNEKMFYSFTPNLRNKQGTATGELVGGNLKTIESICGSKSEIITQNKILFLEDTGEYLYGIDRMFWNLKRSGKLSGIKGLIIGGFKIKKDDEGEEFGKDIEEIVMEKVKEYHYPVCFDFPVGHQKNNFALKCGIKHKLSVLSNECSLIEIR